MGRRNSSRSAPVLRSGGCNAFAKTGLYEPMPRGGSTSPLEKHSRQDSALISAQRDLTLNEIVSALHKRRIPGSRSALSRFFARHGITVKKKSAGGGAQASRRGACTPTLDLRARLLRAGSSGVATSPSRGLGHWPKQGLPGDLHVHDLRHTGNTLASEAGASLGELMNRMGHSSTRAARIYLHTREEREQELAATLDKMARRELKAYGAKRTGLADRARSGHAARSPASYGPGTRQSRSCGLKQLLASAAGRGRGGGWRRRCWCGRPGAAG